MITEKATNTAVGGKGKSVTHSVSSQRVTPIDVTSQPTDENNSGTDFKTLDKVNCYQNMSSEQVLQVTNKYKIGRY